MKIQLLIFIFLISLAPSILAETSYRNIGGNDNTFDEGVGGFNSGVLSSTQTRSLSDGDHVPLIADLNGDGTNEIVIVDGGTIRLYQNTTLTILDSLILPDGANHNYSAPILNDIDNDGFIEIIIADEQLGDGNISILEYNGTHFYEQIEIDFSDIYPALTNGWSIESVIACTGNRTGVEEKQCLYAVALSKVGNDVLYKMSFNATGRKNDTFTTLSSTTGDSLCFPEIAVISVADYDTDGRDEFIFSTIQSSASGNDEIVRIYWIDVESNGLITEEISVSQNAGNSYTVTTAGCYSGNIGKYVSSTLVGDFDGSSGTGLETVVAYNTDADEFEMKLYDNTGATVLTHPKTVDADGEIMGNPMKANVFGDTADGDDYCVFGQAVVRQELNLLCGSALTGYTVSGFPSNTVQFVYDMPSTLYNLSGDYNNPSAIAHSVNMDEASIDVAEGFTDTSEIVTSYGVFQLNGVSYLDGIEIKFPLVRIFSLNTERACVPVDYSQLGTNDLICVNDASVVYVNDNLDNGVAAISEYEENPCIDSIIGVNTTFQATLTVVDQNDFPLPQDRVSSNVTIYYGKSNAQSSLISNQTSGSQQIHLFEYSGGTGGINETGTVTVRYEAWDTEFPNTKDAITQTFTVANTGVTYGDCTSGLIVVDTSNATALSDALPTDSVNNGITTGLVTLHGITGLGGQTWWFIIMVAISISIWGAVGASSGGSAAVGMILIVNTLMLILGAAIGVLSTGLIIVMVVLAIAIIGVFLGKFLMGSGTGE